MLKDFLLWIVSYELWAFSRRDAKERRENFHLLLLHHYITTSLHHYITLRLHSWDAALQQLIFSFHISSQKSPVRDDSFQAGMESVARNACKHDQNDIRVQKARQRDYLLDELTRISCELPPETIHHPYKCYQYADWYSVALCNKFQFNGWKWFLIELISFLFFPAKKRNRKSSPLRINLLKFYRLRWTKINSLRSDSIFVLTAQRQNFLTRFLRGGRDFY